MLKREKSEWLDRNPLYVWRQANGKRIIQTSIELGFSDARWRQWELGVCTPNGPAYVKLIGLIGPDFPQQWEDWMRSKPE
jgi:hypothetical protein